MAAPSSPLIKLSIVSTSRRRFLNPTFRNASSFGCYCSSNSANDGGRRTSSLSTVTKPLSGKVNGAAVGDSEASAVEVDVSTKRGLSFAEKGVWRRIWFETKKVRSIMLLNAITFIYASNIPIVKEIEAVVDPQAFTIVRFSLAALVFSPFVFRARGDVRTRNAGLELGFWVSLGYLMQALGLQTSGAGRASFLTMFTVIVVPLLDGMLGSKIPALTWFGAFVSITGVGMLESSGAPPCVGDLLNFMSAVFFGVHMLRTEHISRSTDRGNFLALLGYQVSVVAFFSTVWYIFGTLSGDPHAFNPSSWTLAQLSDWFSVFPWAAAIYTGIISTGLCLWAELAAMRDVSATEAAIIYGLEPVWGAGFAWTFLGERWGVIGWIGAALVLGGSLTVQIHGATSSAQQIDDTSSQKVEDGIFFSSSSILVDSRKGKHKSIRKRGGS